MNNDFVSTACMSARAATDRENLQGIPPSILLAQKHHPLPPLTQQLRHVVLVLHTKQL